MLPIKVLIAEKQALLRDSLNTVLNLQKDICVVGTAKEGIEAVNKVKSISPDIILLDICIPGLNGVQCTKIIKSEYPNTKVIILSSISDDEYIINCILHGASGYVLKDMDTNMLLEAIYDAAKGKMTIDPSIAAKLAQGFAKVSATLGDSNNDRFFSKREKEVADLLVKGLTNKEISSSLFISEGTLRNYVSKIYNKIGIGERTQAVLYLKEKGFG